MAIAIALRRRVRAWIARELGWTRKRFDLIALREATLCVGCEQITAAKNGHCPACGSPGLISLGALLGSGEPSAAAAGVEGEFVRELRKILKREGGEMKPSIGRIVHYIPAERNVGHLAAIITGEGGEPGVVDLTCFFRRRDTASASGAVAYANIRFSEDCDPGTWHWPEREE